MILNTNYLDMFLQEYLLDVHHLDISFRLHLNILHQVSQAVQTKVQVYQLGSIPSASPSSLLLAQKSKLVGKRVGNNFGDSISMSAGGRILAVRASSGESSLDNMVN